MKLLIATSNPHKIDEIMAVVREPDACLELTSLKDAGVDVPEPVEDQDTFEGESSPPTRLTTPTDLIRARPQRLRL